MSTEPAKSMDWVMWWRRLAYGGAIALPVLCLAGGLWFAFGHKQDEWAPSKPQADEPLPEVVSYEEAEAAAYQTLDAIRERAKMVSGKQAELLAKIGDTLAQELDAMDKRWAEKATHRLADYSPQEARAKHQAFLAEAEKRGLSRKQLQEATFTDWHDTRQRLVTYQTTAKTRVGDLGSTFRKVQEGDPETKIRQTLSNASLAFLTTYERPWRCYVQHAFPPTLGIGTGQYAMSLAGRVTIGYDMTQIGFSKIEMPGEPTTYCVKLPKPEIRDVIFDFDKAEMVRMELGKAMAVKLLRHGSAEFYRDLFRRTHENERFFLEDFARHELFDVDVAQANIVNTLKPYFGLQGNTVIIEPQPTTLREMVKAYLNKEQTAPQPIE